MGKEGVLWSGTRDCDAQVSTSSKREYYIPSVDLLTAQVSIGGHEDISSLLMCNVFVH